MIRVFTAATAICILVLPSVAQDGTASLTGKVQDAAGAIIPGVIAELGLERAPISRFRAVTDGAGIYRFSGLPAGEYDLRLSSMGFNHLTVKSTRISEGEQKSIPPLQLTIATCADHGVRESIRFLPPGDHQGDFVGEVRLEQRSLEDNSPPIAGAKVTLICGAKRVCDTAKTDSQGEFRFVDLPPGEVSIQISHTGFYPLNDFGYAVDEGVESVYRPLYLERCPRGNCDPKRRPKKPLMVCE